MEETLAVAHNSGEVAAFIKQRKKFKISPNLTQLDLGSEYFLFSIQDGIEIIPFYIHSIKHTGNEIGSEGVNYLSEGLKYIPNLTQLNLKCEYSLFSIQDGIEIIPFYIHSIQTHRE